MNQSTSPAADAEAGDATTAVRLGDCRRHPQPLLSICPSVYLSFCLSGLLSICPSVYLSFCVSVLLSIYLSFFVPVLLCACPSVCLSLCVSITQRDRHTLSFVFFSFSKEQPSLLFFPLPFFHLSIRNMHVAYM